MILKVRLVFTYRKVLFITHTELVSHPKFHGSQIDEKFAINVQFEKSIFIDQSLAFFINGRLSICPIGVYSIGPIYKLDLPIRIQVRLRLKCALKLRLFKNLINNFLNYGHRNLVLNKRQHSRE